LDDATTNLENVRDLLQAIEKESKKIDAIMEVLSTYYAVDDGRGFALGFR